MKISIITPTMNSEKTLKDTLQSLRVQRKNGFELESIVIDGGSTDHTLEIVQAYRDVVTQVISEPDHGIYDAMNKGIALATGDIVGILNSDDFYVDDSVLKRVTETFPNQSVNACYGNIVYVRPENTKNIIRRWRGGAYTPFKIRLGWIPPHPAFFVRKQIYEQYGTFRTDLSVAADYELMLRLILVHGIHPVFLDETLVVMRDGGNSARNFKQRVKGWKQIRNAWNVNGLRPPFLLIPLRVLLKIKQLFV